MVWPLYCEHGQLHCTGSIDRALAPCGEGDYRFCKHGVDLRLSTGDGRPVCSFCRGITRRMRNADTPGYRPLSRTCPADPISE